MPGPIRRTPSLLALPLIALALTLAGLAYADAGEFDPSFDTDGVRTIDFGTDSLAEFRDVETLPGGGVLLGGRVRGGDSTEGPTLVQLREDGSLDPALGGDGVIEAVVPTAPRGAVSAVKRLPDGRIVLAGWTARADKGVFVARLLEDGSPDPAFADGGVRLIDVAGSKEATQSDALVLARERIYLGVRASTPEGGKFKVGVVVLDSAGEPVRKFGSDGRVLIPEDLLGDSGSGWLPADSCTGCQENDLGVDERGRVLVSGSIGAFNSRIAVVRLDRQGKVDRRRYGRHGRTVVDFDRPGSRESDTFGGPLVVRPDGSALVAGAHGEWKADGTRGEQGFAVAALKRGGGLDRSFSGDGRQVVPFPASDLAMPHDAVLDARGSLVLGGYVLNRRLSSFIALARVRSSGALDKRFGERGALPTRIPDSQASAVATDEQGRILAAGYAGFSGFGSRPVAIRVLGR
jgi:uncharacterized delta-60 repeat protein